MADFHEVRFPLDVSLGSRGGPQRRTPRARIRARRHGRRPLM
jgi:hypothetical protein